MMRMVVWVIVAFAIGCSLLLWCVKAEGDFHRLVAAMCLAIFSEVEGRLRPSKK